MVTSIANSLGFGSGIDIPKLVGDLASASRDPKVARISTLTAMLGRKSIYERRVVAWEEVDV